MPVSLSCVQSTAGQSASGANYMLLHVVTDRFAKDFLIFLFCCFGC